MLSTNLAKTLIGSCARLTYRTLGQPKLCPAASKSIAKRMMSTQINNCAPDEGPRCSKVRIARSACMKKKKELEKVPPFPFKNLIFNPDCCEDPCPDVHFDDLYYYPSDKMKRKYQQTWLDCPSPLVKKRVVCPPEKQSSQPYERRKLARRKHTCTISKNAWKLGLMPCKIPPIEVCPRIMMPFCKRARVPPSCKSNRGPSLCKKRCTPYPAFSECDREPLRRGKIVECKCLAGASMCEVFAYMRHLKKNLK